MQKTQILKQYFGYDTFREGQEKLINSILEGRDVLGIMPTGAGKSICFQVPALIFSGITLVISPLVSLMKDQVQALITNGVAAAFINSTLSYSQTMKALENARKGKYKIIYVAPERLDSPEFLEFAQNADISMVAVDEAHCVSQWGQNFRPSYLKIRGFIDKLAERPVIAAFTATATSEVKEDIINILELNKPFVLITGFNRENLYFEVQKPKDKYQALLRYLRANPDKSGIIYCSTRKTVEEVCDSLIDDHYDATRYHAGLSENERNINQEDFLYDRKTLMVATNAFGMGIDKSNVAFVIHYNMPKNLESYYQEAGRAGRDGTPAECILLYGKQDVVTNQYLIEKTDNNNDLTPELLEKVREKDRERLKQMTFYCHSSNCLRAYILKYFGEKTAHTCDNCSVCNNVGEEAEDIDFPGGRTAKRERRKEGREALQKTFPINQELFKKLKELRFKLAQEKSVPAFVIFSDATLMDMCSKLPANEAEFLEVSGVGRRKLEAYGKVFLEAVNGLGNTEIPDISEKQSYSLSEACKFIAQNVELSDEPISVSIFADKINVLLMEKNFDKISAQKIADYLLQQGYLEIETAGGKNSRIASEKGVEAGIETILKTRQYGDSYKQNFYSLTAQQYMVDNIEAIIKHARTRQSKRG